KFPSRTPSTPPTDAAGSTSLTDAVGSSLMPNAGGRDVPGGHRCQDVTTGCIPVTQSVLQATEDKAVFRAVNVLRSRPVTSQPEDAIDPAQVEAFGNLVVFSERPGRNRYRARWCPMLRRWKPYVALWLVEVLKSEMGTEFERTQRQAKF